MAAAALLHELLLALLGHTGDCVQPILHAHEPADGDASPNGARFRVVGLSLRSDLPLVSGAERAAIDGLLRAGWHYTNLLQFVQSVDEGAALDAENDDDDMAAEEAAAFAPLGGLSRSLYGAARRILSGSQADSTEAAVPSNALVPLAPIHPLLRDSEPHRQPKGRTQTQPGRLRRPASLFMRLPLAHLPLLSWSS